MAIAADRELRASRTAGGGLSQDDYRGQLEALIEILWDDGERPFEHRAYVSGAWREEIAHARDLLKRASLRFEAPAPAVQPAVDAQFVDRAMELAQQWSQIAHQDGIEWIATGIYDSESDDNASLALRQHLEGALTAAPVRMLTEEEMREVYGAKAVLPNNGVSLMCATIRKCAEVWGLTLEEGGGK